MTVLNGTRPAARGSLLDGAFATFAPKRRPRTEKTARPRRSLAAWLRSHGRPIKDAVVSITAFGAISVAAYEWHPIVGIFVGGISVLLVDKSVDRGAVTDDERAG